MNVASTDIDFTTLLQLKSIPTLKSLRCLDRDKHSDEIKNLKLQLPNISINEEYLHIASPSKGDGDLEWIWEIRATQQDLFPEAHP